MKSITLFGAVAIVAAAVAVAAFGVGVPSVQASANCAPFAYKQCVTNVSYWYNSCGVLQDLYQNCNLTGQACQAGQCVTVQKPTPPTTYVAHNKKACYNSNVYWFDSAGKPNSLIQTCGPSNSCEVGTCQNAQCSAQLKCDGSTCATNSADYATYCLNASGSGQGQNQGGQNGQTGQGSQGGQVQGASQGLTVTMFGRKDSEPVQWEKTVQAGQNDRVYFLVTVKNTSSSPLQDVTLTADISSAITYEGNLSVNGTATAGNLSSGIDLGPLGSNAADAIVFSGIVNSSNAQTAQVSANATSGSLVSSDGFSINISGQSANPASQAGSGFINWLKKWYLWIIVIIVLLVLFVIIFRRLSKES